MFWFFPGKMLLVYQCYTLGTLINPVCHVWWAPQYYTLWATYRNLESECPDAEWEWLSASLNTHTTTTSNMKVGLQTGGSLDGRGQMHICNSSYNPSIQVL